MTDTNQTCAPDAALEPGSRRFIIGIDLGTTNSAVAYVDLAAPAAKQPIQLFKVPQLTAPGVFQPLPVLPSFLYLPGPYDIDPAAARHPWPKPEDAFVGTWARDQGAKVPARLVSSAKSWLCHARVDRQARILPWGAPEEVYKVSPVQASAAYLDHIRKAWNHSRGDEEELFLENQTMVLTVPASFDEVARELTLAAARQAGYRHVTLLEEPLAAFYSWLARHEQKWEAHVQPGQLILICDVGGGTTDFTLVTLTAVEGGTPRFNRIAVGDHLLLGGDNMDLALARGVETRWRGEQRVGLDTNRWKALSHQCRQAKERVLGGESDSQRITLMGAGSRLIAGTLSADLDRAVIEQTILDGFFPLLSAQVDRPAAQRPAIAEFGLPYESEPAVTRHLMRFLERHRAEVTELVGKSDPVPDRVLFNGGALTPEPIQQRILDAITHWYGAKAAARPGMLENRHHDLAVALGAAYYGLVKIGKGVRVGSGSPRSYYLGVAPGSEAATAPQALCLIERGLDEGSAIQLGDQRFEVLTNQPVRFDLFSSSFRNRDRMGQLVAIDDSFIALPPLTTVIQYGKKGTRSRIPVRIEAEYTEMGTLSLWCRSLASDHRWQLQFQLRDSEPQSTVREEIVLEEKVLAAAAEALRGAFGGSDKKQLEAVAKTIATAVDLSREQWPLRLLRHLADLLIDQVTVLNKSAEHAARWMNLLGFCLRPGFGDALDAERLKQLWKIQNAGPVFPNQPQVQIEWYVMWRRVAGGLTPGQQRQLSQQWGRVLPSRKGKTARLPAQHQLEIWMAVANLERLYVKDKIQWGRQLLDRVTPNQARPQHLWSLARLGARELLYGSNDRVIPPEEVARWIEALLARPWPHPKAMAAALAQMARKTGDRTRDVSPAVQAQVLAWMESYPDLADQRRYIEEVVPIAQQEEQTLFGESLPVGLILHGRGEEASGSAASG
jgi:molecular chaperone DnaK (HSP70)